VPAVRVDQHQVLLLQQLQLVAAASLLQELPPVLDQGRRPPQRPRRRRLPQGQAPLVFVHSDVDDRGQEPAPRVGFVTAQHKQRQHQPLAPRRRAVIVEQHRHRHGSQKHEPHLIDRSRRGATGPDIRRPGGGAGVPLRASPASASASPGLQLRRAAAQGRSGAAGRRHGGVHVLGRGDLRTVRRRVGGGGGGVLERRRLLDGRRPGPERVPSLAS
jgi:hypothetical protein